VLSSINYKGLLLGIVPFLITGCETEPFTVQPFTAKYYVEEDGMNPGAGNDGSDTSIVPVLKYTETVTRPAIAYSYDNEFDIDSHNLYATWEGNITANEDTTLNANFDVSWSDVSFYLDDLLVSKWANSDKVIPLTLETGEHTVRIEYHNHWHTTGFNASFTNYTQTDTSEDLSALVTETTQISFIDAYEADTGNSRYNEVVITLPEGSRSHILFLSSHDAVNWVINNPYDVDLPAVVFNSYGPGTTVTNAGDTLILHATDLRRYGGMNHGAEADVASMTGREPDYIHTDYAMGDFDLPNL
jgi:hypothetical protein